MKLVKLASTLAIAPDQVTELAIKIHFGYGQTYSVVAKLRGGEEITLYNTDTFTLAESRLDRLLTEINA